MNRPNHAVLIAVALFCGPGSLSAQQVNVGAPFHSAGHSFYEQVGASWGLRGNGWFANFGGPAPAPAFGGFDPNAQANFGFGGKNGFLNITAGQGNDSSLVSSTPSVTVMNGGMGFFSDTVQRPFVTGLIPVVGGGVGPVMGPSVLEERLHRLQAEGAAAAASGQPPPALVFPPTVSTAERGDASVAAIKARKSAEAAATAAAAQSEIDVLVEKARGAEADGKPAVAKLFWQMAARRASGEQRDEIVKQVQRLDSAR